MDDLSDILKNHNIGCDMNGECMNHMFYADDSILLAPSPSVLQKLLNICHEFGSKHELSYNAKKTVCMALFPL